MVGRADVYPLVSKIAMALLQLARLANPDLASRKSPDLASRKSNDAHRHILKLIEAFPVTRASYLQLLEHLVCNRAELTSSTWDTLCPLVASIATAIAGCELTSSRCTQFLRWSLQTVAATEQYKPPNDNVYRYPPEAPKVAIRLGSIHSVKGETHTATLVLDSFFYQHHLQQLKPWLLGTKTGGGRQNDRMQSRLRLHYVAMTRPSHLLCLAMRRDTVSDPEVETLRTKGWHIIDCGDPPH
jgi:DNA helicase II / ATP-dependent DNA helicase PcrA